MNVNYYPGDFGPIRLALEPEELTLLAVVFSVALATKTLDDMPLEGVSQEEAEKALRTITARAGELGIPKPKVMLSKMAESPLSLLTGTKLIAAQALSQAASAYSSPCKDCGADPDDLCDDCQDASGNHSAG